MDYSLIIPICIGIGIVLTKIAEVLISVFSSKRKSDREDVDQAISHYHAFTQQLQDRIDNVHKQLLSNYEHLAKIEDSYRDEIKELLDQLYDLKNENSQLHAALDLCQNKCEHLKDVEDKSNG